MNSQKGFSELAMIERTIKFQKLKFKKIIHFISNESSENLQTEFFVSFNKRKDWQQVKRYTKN